VGINPLHDIVATLESKCRARESHRPLLKLWTTLSTLKNRHTATMKGSALNIDIPPTTWPNRPNSRHSVPGGGATSLQELRDVIDSDPPVFHLSSISFQADWPRGWNLEFGFQNFAVARAVSHAVLHLDHNLVPIVRLVAF
jgi:hypothetical protein